MSIEQIQETIDGYYDRMIEAMCSGDGYVEQEYTDIIDYWEEQKETLELVLN